MEFRTYFSTCDPDYFLLEQGFDLVRIATLQSVFMIVAMVTEFPSGIWADLFGRKQIYMATVVTLFCSYLLIGFFSDHFIVILFAYVLYGLSVALKSGTLEAEVVLEFEKEQRDIKSLFSSIILCNEYFFNSRQFAGKFIL